MANRFLVGLGMVGIVVCQIVTGLAAAAIHLWSILIAYSSGGFLPALATFLLPVVAELYWGYQSIRITGYLLNWYTLALLGCALSYGMFCLSAWLVEKSEKKSP